MTSNAAGMSRERVTGCAPVRVWVENAPGAPLFGRREARCKAVTGERTRRERFLAQAASGVTRIGRTLFAVADGAQAAGGDAHADQEVLDGHGALLAERDVVVVGAALVAVAFEQHGLARDVKQLVAVVGQVAALVGADRVLVEVEVHGRQARELLLRGRRRRRRLRRHILHRLLLGQLGQALGFQRRRRGPRRTPARWPARWPFGTCRRRSGRCPTRVGILCAFRGGGVVQRELGRVQFFLRHLGRRTPQARRPSARPARRSPVSVQWISFSYHLPLLIRAVASVLFRSLRTRFVPFYAGNIFDRFSPNPLRATGPERPSTDRARRSILSRRSFQ